MPKVVAVRTAITLGLDFAADLLFLVTVIKEEQRKKKLLLLLMTADTSDVASYWLSRNHL